MKNRRKALIVLALASVMITGSIATAFAATTNGKTNATEAASQASEKNRHGKKEKIAEPDNAIGKDKAQAEALKDAGIASDKVEKIRTRVSKLDDGTVVYKVGFVYGDKYYSYKINALTGAVADKSEKSADDMQNGHGHKKDKAEISGTEKSGNE